MSKKVYLASGWFTPHTKEIVDNLELVLASVEGLDVYSPRRDGTKLTPNEFGNTEVRRKVFQDNVDNILKADFLVAVVDGKDGHLDTGTLWEIGLASAYGIPVIGFEVETENNGRTILGGVASCLSEFVWGYENLKSIVGVDYMKLDKPTIREYEANWDTYNKAMIIGPDFTPDHVSVGLDVLATVQSADIHSRLVDRPSNTAIGEYADALFKDVDYMIAVVDDRHPGVAWAMGQAYARQLPIISFTNHDYGVNLMLLLSIVRHVKGTETLATFLTEVKEKGIRNIEQIDYADVKAI